MFGLFAVVMCTYMCHDYHIMTHLSLVKSACGDVSRVSLLTEIETENGRVHGLKADTDESFVEDAA